MAYSVMKDDYTTDSVLCELGSTVTVARWQMSLPLSPPPGGGANVTE